MDNRSNSSLAGFFKDRARRELAKIPQKQIENIQKMKREEEKELAAKRQALVANSKNFFDELNQVAKQCEDFPSRESINPIALNEFRRLFDKININGCEFEHSTEISLNKSLKECNELIAKMADTYSSSSPTFRYRDNKGSLAELIKIFLSFYKAILKINEDQNKLVEETKSAEESVDRQIKMDEVQPVIMSSVSVNKENVSTQEAVEIKFLAVDAPIKVEAQKFFDMVEESSDEEFVDVVEGSVIVPVKDSSFYDFKLSNASIKDFKGKLASLFLGREFEEPEFANDRKKYVTELINRIELINDKEKQIELLGVAYHHSAFSAHRHLTGIRDVFNGAYNKLRTLNCCGFFAGSLQRDLIETNSQKALAECIRAKAKL